jgi:hypothetical protein
MMLKFLKPTAKNQFQRRTPTYIYYSQPHLDHDHASETSSVRSSEVYQGSDGYKSGNQNQVHQGHVDVKLLLLHCTMMIMMMSTLKDMALQKQAAWARCQGLLAEEKHAATADPEGQTTMNTRRHHMEGLQSHSIVLLGTTVSLDVVVGVVPRVIQVEG